MRLVTLVLLCLLLPLPVMAEEAPPSTGNSLQETLAPDAPVIAERLDNALLKMGEWVETTEAFAVEQAPFLVQEIIWWGIAKPAFLVGLGLFFIIVGLSWGIVSYRHYDRFTELAKRNLDFVGGFLQFLSFFVPIFYTLLGLVLIFVNVMNVVKPIVAPRLYLIEYFRSLVN